MPLPSPIRFMAARFRKDQLAQKARRGIFPIGRRTAMTPTRFSPRHAPSGHAAGRAVSGIMEGISGVLGGHPEQEGQRISPALREHLMDPYRNRQMLAQEDRAGRQPNAMEWERGVEEERTLAQIQEALNNHGLLAENRRLLPRDKRELHDLRLMFMKAFQEGQIRSSGEKAMREEFRQYLYRYFLEMARDPEFAMAYNRNPVEYANNAVNRFMKSFKKDEFEKLQLVIMRNSERPNLRYN